MGEKDRGLSGQCAKRFAVPVHPSSAGTLENTERRNEGTAHAKPGGRPQKRIEPCALGELGPSYEDSERKPGSGILSNRSAVDGAHTNSLALILRCPPLMIGRLIDGVHMKKPQQLELFSDGAFASSSVRDGPSGILRCE
jgi:hypothetical protein